MCHNCTEENGKEGKLSERLWTMIGYDGHMAQQDGCPGSSVCELYLTQWIPHTSSGPATRVFVFSLSDTSVETLSCRITEALCYRWSELYEQE